jgi:uncharacterized protein YecE (DUF72 family)
MAEIRIGVSGWRYTPWRGVFYPRELPQRLELAYAARKFPTLEINGSFYSLQRPEYYREWHDATPADFVFALKGSRFITHMKKLRDIDAPLANYFASGVFELRRKLGPILWQFPPNFRYERERMARFFGLLPHDTHAALRLARKRDARMKGRAPRRRREASAATCGRDPSRELPRCFVRRAASRAQHCARDRGNREALADAAGHHRRFRLPAAARRQGVVPQRLQRSRARSLGGAHQGLASRAQLEAARRVLLLRQYRRETASARRCPDADA